jgi:hypothetical protein
LTILFESQMSGLPAEVDASEQSESVDSDRLQKAFPPASLQNLFPQSALVSYGPEASVPLQLTATFPSHRGVQLDPKEHPESNVTEATAQIIFKEIVVISVAKVVNALILVLSDEYANS